MKSLAPILAALLALGLACSTKNSSTQTSGDGGTTDSCGGDIANDEFCASCTVSANASPATCKAPRVVNACCAFLQAPSQELARGTGLHRFTSDSPTLDLGCLAAPPAAGASKPITLKGFVRLFSSGNDSKGVKIEIFEEGKDGALGEPVGNAVVTTESDAEMMPKPDWPSKCPDGGCSFRAYSYAGVPTETPLVIKTSDATGGQQWAALYDYNVYIANSAVSATDEGSYEVSAVAATDLNTVASAAGGFTIRQDRGLLAGEVHDCADVRVSGATVDTDVAHEGDMFYFGENEADPLPDKSRGTLGTSKIGLFGALNVTAGVPVRLSAVGKVNGTTTLLGTHVVQTFPGSVTALSFRGRRPYQK